MTSKDIWTTFGTKHKYHTINTPEWPNSHNLKIQDGGCRHLEFRKMSITPHWIFIQCGVIGIFRNLHHYLHQILREDAPRPCGDDHVTKNRNRKLIRVTSPNESQKHKCVDLSDYNIYLNQIWYYIQSSNSTLSTRRNGQIHITWKSKIAAATILDFQVMWKEKCQ